MKQGNHATVQPGGRRRIRYSSVAIAALLVAQALAPAQEPAPGPPQPEGPKQDEQLGERLIRDAASGGGEDPMENMLRLMDDAARNLEIEFDAGPQTQTVQARILDELDRAIKLAAAHRRSARARSSQFTGEKRTRQKGRPDARQTAENAEAASPAEAASAAPGARDAPSEPVKGELREVRRSWGLLPERQRDEILQGSNESSLERYREWIERYYRALQETPE